MKAKKAAVYIITVLVIGISFIYSSCKKTSSDCAPIAYAAISPVVVLEIKNNQNRDLLDPATPGHYDTAYIKRSNPWLGITRPGISPVLLVFSYLHINENILTLSTTDQDTLNISVQTVAEKCYTYTKITEFKYNDAVLKADSVQGSLYVAHK